MSDANDPATVTADAAALYGGPLADPEIAASNAAIQKQLHKERVLARFTDALVMALDTMDGSEPLVDYKLAANHLLRLTMEFYKGTKI